MPPAEQCKVTITYEFYCVLPDLFAVNKYLEVSTRSIEIWGGHIYLTIDSRSRGDLLKSGGTECQSIINFNLPKFGVIRYRRLQPNVIVSY